jgi:hypothetical protein
MKLFYGSKSPLVKPEFGMGNPTNDYGLGFYMTDEVSLAELWACQYQDGGYAITYKVNLNGLNVLHLSEGSELTILRWITLLVKHRFPYQERLANKQTVDWLIKHFDTPIDQYDVVIGYRADDSYFNYSLGFVRGEVSLETLAKAMKLGRLGLQYVLVSKKAFSRIEYVSSHEVPHREDYKSFREKILGEYHELLRQENRFNNTFIGELMKKYGE